MTKNKFIKGKFHVRTMLKDAFGFAKHQENAIYGLSLKVTLTRNKEDAVLNHIAALADARNKIDIHWYVPHYASSIQLIFSV